MKEVFIDTGYLLALLNPRDGLHERATTADSPAGARFVTTRAVLLELADALCGARWRGLAADVHFEQAGFRALLRGT